MSDLYHIESEQSVIGALLQDPAAIDRIDWLVEGDFYREDHRTIFRAISLMVAEKKPVDAITVAEALLSSGVRETDIGLAYLGELVQNVPSSANIRRYAEVVVEKRMRRRGRGHRAEVPRLARPRLGGDGQRRGRHPPGDHRGGAPPGGAVRPERHHDAGGPATPRPARPPGALPDRVARGPLGRRAGRGAGAGVLRLPERGAGAPAAR